MPSIRSSLPEDVRTADVIAVTCLATDLGMGLPFEHGLKTTLAAMRLARLLGVSRQERVQTYYTALLTYAGCTTDAADASRIFGQSLTEHLTPLEHGSSRERLRGVARSLPPRGTPPLALPFVVLRRLPAAARYQTPHYIALCEVASMLAERLGVGSEVSQCLLLMTERWDGDSVLGRAQGEEIPLAVRIVQVVRDAALQHVLGGIGHAVSVLRDRAGHAFDPAIATAFTAHADEILPATDEVGSLWDAVLEEEPEPWSRLSEAGMDRAVEAIGNFADLVSPWLSGHSEGVAKLAASAARAMGMADEGVRTVRYAGHLQDLGRVAVDPAVWDKPGQLSADEWEQVRLHAYHTDRILRPSSAFGNVADHAGSHHECLDGSGYHRGLRGGMLQPTARLLAAADAFQAMTEPRSYRLAMTPVNAAVALAQRVEKGELDAAAVEAVTAAAGEPVGDLPLPHGLTRREAQILGLLARSLQSKQVAKTLGISMKTVDNHTQSLYRKIGVSSRAGATLFAMEHGLVAWGEHPMS